MPLRPGLLWLTLNLALIIQCLSINYNFPPPILHTLAYPRLKTTNLGYQNTAEKGKKKRLNNFM
jgi:hypothetical protein